MAIAGHRRVQLRYPTGAACASAKVLLVSEPRTYIRLKQLHSTATHIHASRRIPPMPSGAINRINAHQPRVVKVRRAQLPLLEVHGRPLRPAGRQELHLQRAVAGRLPVPARGHIWSTGSGIKWRARPSWRPRPRPRRSRAWAWWPRSGWFRPAAPTSAVTTVVGAVFLTGLEKWVSHQDACRSQQH